MDRRQFLKWGSFITVSVATTGLAGCGGGDDNPDPPEPDLFDFRHGVASGDPRPDSVVLWTRVEGDNGRRHVNVRLQVSTQEDFSTLVVNDHLRALPEWDYTLRTKVTGLNAATTYYYRFRVGSRFSPVGRTRTAPAAGTPLSQLKFAFVSCQDWSINHWAGMEELAQQDLDFIVHTGDYIYEAVADGAPVNLVESRHTPLSLPNGTTLPSGFRYATTLEDYRYLYKAYRSDARLQALHARFPMIAIWDDHEFSDDCWQDRQSYDADDDQSPQTARRRSANQAWFEYLPADVTLDLNNPSFQNIQIYRSFTFGNLATLLMTDERLYRADHLISEANAGGDVGSRFFIRRDALKAAEDAKIAAAGGALTQVSMLGDAQRAWWQDRVGGAATTWKLWGNQVSLLRMQIDLTEAIAQLMVLRLIASNTALAPLRDQMETALTADLRAALSSGTYPNNVAYANLRQLLSTQAGIDSATFDANIKPALDSRLPPASLLATYVLNGDQWDGYDAERRNLMAFLKTNNVRNVVALTGDIHAFFAGVVMDDFDAATPTPVMVDLVAAGLSSNTLMSTYKSVVDNDPRFAEIKALVYEEVSGAVVNTLNRTLQHFNPWMRYAETNVTGYAIVTLTPDKLNCAFHIMKGLVDGNAPPQPATASVTTVEVPAGSAVVNVV